MAKNTTNNKKQNNNSIKIISVNKKARFNYEINDVYEAGIVLEGSEVKSIRAGHISLIESFVFIRNNEVFLKNAYIKPYENSSAYTPDSKRTRKLLLKKQEILKLKHKLDAMGYTIIPLKVYIKNNLVKIEIGLGKGKKLYDKRETIKKRTIERDIARHINT